MMPAVSLLAVLCLAGPAPKDAPLVRVGSKAFTESHILAELVCLLAREEGANVEHRARLGATSKPWAA
jgi:glycine betaine/choline ABC-type transport system substrate-binding protein